MHPRFYLSPSFILGYSSVSFQLPFTDSTLFSASFVLSTFGGSFLYMSNLSQVAFITNKNEALVTCIMQGATALSTVSFLVFGNFMGMNIYDCFKIMLSLAIVLPSITTLNHKLLLHKHENGHKYGGGVIDESTVHRNHNDVACASQVLEVVERPALLPELISWPEPPQKSVKNSLFVKTFRQLIYLSLHLYSTIISLRLVLFFYKLEFYLSSQKSPEQLRPLLAIFQILQIIPSVSCGLLYDKLDKITNCITSSIIMSFFGVILFISLNFSLNLSPGNSTFIIFSLVLATLLNSFCFGFLASFGNKFTSKPKNSALCYGLLNTSYALASLPVIQEYKVVLK